MKQLMQCIIIKEILAGDDKIGATGLAAWQDGRRYDLRASRRASTVLGAASYQIEAKG